MLVKLSSLVVAVDFVMLKPSNKMTANIKKLPVPGPKKPSYKPIKLHVLIPNAPMDSRAWRSRSLALGEKEKKSAKLIKSHGMMAFKLSLLRFWTNKVPHIAPKKAITMGVLS